VKGPREPAAEGFARFAGRVSGFRTRLLVATMLVVSGLALAVLYVAERRLAANASRALGLEFQGAVSGLHHSEEIRQAVMTECCRQLARRPRIHAALEDDALELLYPSAQDELSSLITADRARPAALQVEFCRFLGPDGAVIRPSRSDAVGALAPADEAKLSLPALPGQQEIGFIELPTAAAGEADSRAARVSEVIATPIVSTESGEIIAALVLGFEPIQLASASGASFRSGLWLDGKVFFPADRGFGGAFARRISDAVAGGGHAAEANFRAPVAGTDSMVFIKRLNPDSIYPPAYEVCVYPLTELAASRRRLRWEVLAAAGAVLLAAFAASELLSRGFATPVEQLAAESERSARFSADASHQLKTPVTVLRAGLEELLSREHFSPQECTEISALIHQTYRLSSLIEDLLLLSRMDAGRLTIERSRVELGQLIDACCDDLDAIPDSASPEVETDLKGRLRVFGEKRYTAMILQNLLENARKYNRPSGRIRIASREDERFVYVAIGNTGPGIAAEAKASIFERFHRGRFGEEVPGYGLGLNLARELARIHGGDLRLVRSENDWTEFELKLERAPAAETGEPARGAD
jgi:signal transduction histidine kinase